MTKRYYGDNGQLIRYEMENRGKQYYRAAQVEKIKSVAYVVLPALLVAVIIARAVTTTY